MSQIIYPVSSLGLALNANLNVAQAAATYDLATATGDVLILAMAVFCTTVGATWTSVTIQTNDTVPFTFMNATEGARANFVAGSNVAITWAQVQKPWLQSTKKIQYTIAGSTGTGAARALIWYVPTSQGAVLA